MKALDGGRHVPGVPDVERRHGIQADKMADAFGQVECQPVDYARKVVRIIQTLVTTTASTREACAPGELVSVQPVNVRWEGGR